MENKLYDNADSFSMSFDDEWPKVDCENLQEKIEKVLQVLSSHPFVISNPDKAKDIAEFRIFSLKKFQ